MVILCILYPLQINKLQNILETTFKILLNIIMINNNVFLEVEKLFTDEIYRKMRFQTNLNFCCDEETEQEIITMTDIIKKIPEFSDLSYRDIYFVLIYTYYSLRFNEQTEDWLKMKFFKQNIVKFELSKKLYFSIVSGDIIVNGENLSSAIRKHILEMNGGNKIKKHTKKYKKTLKKNKKHNRKMKQKTKRNN